MCAPCISLWATPVQRCSRCALAVPTGMVQCGVCLLHPPPYSSAVAAFDYAFPWDGLISRFKFNAALDLAGLLAGQLGEAIERAHAEVPDLVLPVPLSPRRMRERGYNQAWEVARRLRRTGPWRTEPTLLLRVKNTPHQTTLPPGERAANVRGAFAIEPLRAAEVRGRRIAVVDDVVTTGATVAELSGVLLGAGAASVQVWMLARTPPPDR